MMEPPQDNLMLQVRSISKSFTRGSQRNDVLSGVDFTAKAGEFITIVGASGCGKTTLLRVIGGLEAPSAGTILIDGEEIIGPGTDRGYVFQRDNLLPWRTVLRNITFVLEIGGMPKGERMDIARYWLERVGLLEFESYFPNEISGGMQQRVNLARALAIRPKLLLMDEPFAALDAQTREVMQTELLRLWKEDERRTIIFITHQIEEALFLGDRVLVFGANPGRIRRIIDVPLPRPRDLSIKRSAPFGELVNHVWKLIEEEVWSSQNKT